jgi:hypothetical protein
MNGNQPAPLLLARALFATMMMACGSLALADNWSHVPDPYERATACATATAGDIWTWPNTPSTICQRMGCGVGAGYHAPMVFNPVPTWRCNHHGVEWRTASRLPANMACATCEMQTFAPTACRTPPAAPVHQVPLHHHRHEMTPVPRRPVPTAPAPRREVFGAPDVNRNAPTESPSPVEEPQSPSDADTSGLPSI